MVSKYKSSSVTGDSWRRAKRIVIENTAIGSKVIRFIEETITVINGVAITSEPNVIETKVDDAAMGDTIDLIDPETGDFTGASISYAQIYGILYSAYMKKAMERDALETPVSETSSDPVPAPSPTA
jgi:hypothetical protein